MTVARGRFIAKLHPEAYRAQFLRRVLRQVVEEASTGCWLWAGQRQNNGYASVRYRGRIMPAHRATFMAFTGPIPDGKEVCHSCDVRNCVNPSHLYLASHAENMQHLAQRGPSKTPVIVPARRTA